MSRWPRASKRGGEKGIAYVDGDDNMIMLMVI